eukprot:TRINITY_DN32337_c0_g1_i1.p1 TRINITY_DN32337_c0_g1~~TRINITY_DN32337_c0_g1_i1.p1  ORF type:complete len:545 (-),score=35.42 TRINITY_DN32337_c0_g1_i1:30-1664(-)
MIDYRAGKWGFHLAFGWRGSVAPRAIVMAVPNAVITFIVATALPPELASDEEKSMSTSAQMLIAAFTSVMIFILHDRSTTAYDRWWEGGTLLQKTRGEWFNAYSSIIAFTSNKPEMQKEVMEYSHFIARLMSLLMCCGLQQVSPKRDTAFEILDLKGIDPESLEFLNNAPDKVEIIVQWIQRSIVFQIQSGVLPVPPPILSRAFQEVSRGIVNLQNARKIADFPYPYPLAQISMVLQLFHYVMMPFGLPLAVSRYWAVLVSFFSIFCLWCIHFNALDLEFPFGNGDNDLPMHEMQNDWNDSLCTLVDRKATQPPSFGYDSSKHDDLSTVMSDATNYVPQYTQKTDKGIASIKLSSSKRVVRRRAKSVSFVRRQTGPMLTDDLGSPPLSDAWTKATDKVSMPTAGPILSDTHEILRTNSIPGGIASDHHTNGAASPRPPSIDELGDGTRLQHSTSTPALSAGCNRLRLSQIASSEWLTPSRRIVKPPEIGIEHREFTLSRGIVNLPEVGIERNEFRGSRLLSASRDASRSSLNRSVKHGDNHQRN